jgi:hypothetical protein
MIALFFRVIRAAGDASPRPGRNPEHEWDHRRVSRARPIALLLAVAVAGCGGSGGSSARHAAPAPERDAPAVIRAWADTLRRGDIPGAAKFFALPSVVSNGTPPIELHTRADARLFNASLPCGARLVKTSSSGRFTTATFRLTERPGPGTCGSGTGLLARTTFVISHGKIEQWRRVANVPAPSGRTV